MKAVLFAGYLLGTTPSIMAAPEPSREYRIKAAFLFNFISFVEWPEEARNDTEEPVVVTILGETPFGTAFEKHQGSKIKGRHIQLRTVAGFNNRLTPRDFNDPVIKEKFVQLKKSHLLFICESEKQNVPRIVENLRGTPIVVVADMPGVLQSGVCINFVVVKNKVGFEVNLVAAEAAGLKLRAKLLTIAKRVIK